MKLATTAQRPSAALPRTFCRTATGSLTISQCSLLKARSHPGLAHIRAEP
jgi:hypothetical protein